MEFFLTVLGLLLVLEGLGPAAGPAMMRRMYRQLAEIDERSLRVFGVFFMVLGALLIYFGR